MYNNRLRYSIKKMEACLVVAKKQIWGYPYWNK